MKLFRNCIILWLLTGAFVFCASRCHGQGGLRNGAWVAVATRPATVSGEPAAPSTPILAETFEGAGYAAPTWNESGDAGADYVIDEDYTGVVLAGEQTLLVGRISFGSSTSIKTLASAYAEVYGRFKFKFVTRRDNVQFFNLKDNEGNTLLGLSVVAGKLRMTVNAAGTDSTQTFADNTTYYIWVHYLKGSGANSVSEAWFSETSTKPSDASGYYAYKTDGTRTTDFKSISCLQSGGSVAGNSYGLYDNLYLSETSF